MRMPFGVIHATRPLSVTKTRQDSVVSCDCSLAVRHPILVESPMCHDRDFTMYACMYLIVILSSQRLTCPVRKLPKQD